MSADGKLAAYGGFWYPDAGPLKGAIRIFEIATGKEVRTLESSGREMDYAVLGFTPDGKFLVSFGGGSLRVREIASGTELLEQKFPEDNGPRLAISPDGQMLAVTTGPNTHKLFVWKWQSGEEPRELKLGLERQSALAFSPDSKRLAVTCEYGAPSLVCDVASGRRLFELLLPHDQSTRWRADFSPDGKVIALPAQNHRAFSGSVHFFDAATGKHQSRLDLAVDVGQPAFSPDWRRFATPTGSAFRVWEYPALKEIAPNDEAHSAYISQIAVTSSGLAATASDDHTVRLWDLSTGKHLRRFPHGHWVRSLALSPDGRTMASSSLDDTVRLWDVEAGRVIFKLPGHGSSGGQRSLGFTPDGRRLLWPSAAAAI